MFDNAWWLNYGPSIVVPSVGFVEAWIVAYYGLSRRIRPIKAFAWILFATTVPTGAIIRLAGTSAVWVYAAWAIVGTIAMIAGASGRGKAIGFGGLALFALGVVGYLPVSIAHVTANAWTYVAIIAGSVCGAIVTILGLRDDERTAYIVGVGCMITSVGMGVMWMLTGGLPSHHILVPFLAICTFGIVRGSGNAEGRAIISSLFLAALVAAFYGSAFAATVARDGWVYAGMGAAWIFGNACGAVCALRRERSGVVYGVGLVVSAAAVGVLWLDNGGLVPVWVIIPLQALSVYAIYAGAGGKSDGTLSFGIAGTLAAIAAYTVGFWGDATARVGVFITVTIGLLLATTFAAPARAQGRSVTRVLARAAAIIAYTAGIVHLTAGSPPLYVPAAPFFLLGTCVVFVASARHEGVGIVGGIVWSIVATAGFWLALAAVASAYPWTSASATVNVGLLVALIAYRLWVGGAHAPAAATARKVAVLPSPIPGLPSFTAVSAAAQWKPDDDSVVRSQRDAILKKTRDAWEERKRTLEAADPMWQEARLLRWVQEHRPSFWTCSTEWRENVLDATCPVCSRGFGLDPDSDEEDEEEPAFVCSNQQCRAVLHKQCFLKTRGTMSMCPGIEGCTSTLEDGFKPVYRYSTEGGTTRYRTLPEIRARAKELGIDDWERRSRVDLVREIQNRERHEPCFATRPDACPDAECAWRTNCLSANSIERFRAPRPAGRSMAGLKIAGANATFMGARPNPSPLPRAPQPSVARPSPNMTFLHSGADLDAEPAQLKPETATPVHMPALRWPPRQGQ